MTKLEKKKTKETRLVEEFLREHFTSFPEESPPEAYRQNLASIRVRVISDRFQGLSMTQREKLILPVIRRLPDEIQSDISMLLLLTPEEKEDSLMNWEFENPARSRL